MRPSDALVGAGMAGLTPLSLALMERVSPSYAGAGGYKSVLRVSWFVGLFAGGMMAYTRSNRMFRYSPILLPISDQQSSALLWSLRKCSRSRDGHARNGHKGEEGSAPLRRVHHDRIYARRRSPKFKILGIVHVRNALVQLRQPQPAWRRYCQILPASGERVRGRESGPRRWHRIVINSVWAFSPVMVGELYILNQELNSTNPVADNTNRTTVPSPGFR